MRFRFRAQAALDLRRREHDETRRALAHAEIELRAAQRAVDEADAALAAASARCAETLADRAQLDWYRFWIARLQRERAALVEAVAARERDLSAAGAACARTHQRVRSLERFKEKAEQAHERALLDIERRELDALATMRFVAAARASDGGI